MTYYHKSPSPKSIMVGLGSEDMLHGHKHLLGCTSRYDRNGC